MKNILISTGGSGGHIVPATIRYEHLNSEFNILMTADDRGIKFLDKEKYPYKDMSDETSNKNLEHNYFCEILSE